MAKGKVSVILFALMLALEVIWRTICAPSGRAMKGSRCHESGIGRGIDFEVRGLLEGEVAMGAWDAFSVVSGRGG
jgi:hypothetical protein